MKKLSNRDWAIAIVIGFIFFVIGFAVNGLFSNPKMINVENPLNIQLKKSNDSLESLIYYRDSLIKESEKRQFKADSIIVSNHKTLKKEYEKIKNFNSASRIRYIDSVLRTVGVRR